MSCVEWMLGIGVALVHNLATMKQSAMTGTNTKMQTIIKPPTCTQPQLTQWAQEENSRWSKNTIVVKVGAFLLGETISRNHVESGDSLASCDQKSFSPKNVPDPFFTSELKRQSRKRQRYSTSITEVKTLPSRSSAWNKRNIHKFGLPVIKF